MFNSRKQLLYRFLKNNKLFTNEVVKNRIIFVHRGLTETNISVGVFDDKISWCGTVEGYKFWLTTQCNFLLFIIKHDVNNLFNHKLVKEVLSKMINRCKNEFQYTNDKSYIRLIEYYSTFL